VPELDLVIVVLTNGQSDLAFRSTDDAMAALLPDFRERLTAERAQPQAANQPNPVPATLLGLWIGNVETYEGDVPIALNIRAAGSALATLNGHEHEIEQLQLASGRLVGNCDGNMGTSDTAGSPHRIHLDLNPYAGTLSGCALTVGTNQNGQGGAPGKRYGNALPYWCELSLA
jgi:hypothetical protein